MSLTPRRSIQLLAVLLKAALHFRKKQVGIDRPLVKVEHRPAAVDAPSAISLPQVQDTRTDVVIKLICL